MRKNRKRMKMLLIFMMVVGEISLFCRTVPAFSFETTEDSVFYTTSNAGKWIKIGNYWKYKDAKGKYVKNSWKKIKGKYYYFDHDGRMKTGWIKLKGVWYFLNSDGSRAEGWKKLGGSWYYLTPGSGKMKTGWYKVKGKWYYSNSTGAMKTGWIKLKGTWYYLNSDGSRAEGWKKLGGSWYYLTPGSGKMKTGTAIINGKKQVFDSSGIWVGNYLEIYRDALSKQKVVITQKVNGRSETKSFSMKYFNLLDIDENGVKELLVDQNGYDTYYIVFGAKSDKIQYLGAVRKGGGLSYSYNPAEKGLVASYGGSGAAGYGLFQVKNNSLKEVVKVYAFFNRKTTYELNDKPCSEQTYLSKYNRYFNFSAGKLRHYWFVKNNSANRQYYLK